MIVKPNREPDYVDAKGGYYWFDELLYLSGTTSQWVELDYHPKYNKLIKKDYKCKSSWCDCSEDEECPGLYIDSKAEAVRQELITKAFEDAFLG